jgi:hypothetical protein
MSSSLGLLVAEHPRHPLSLTDRDSWHPPPMVPATELQASPNLFLTSFFCWSDISSWQQATHLHQKTPFSLTFTSWWLLSLNSRGDNEWALKCQRKIFIPWIADSGMSTATHCHSMTGTAHPPPPVPPPAEDPVTLTKSFFYWPVSSLACTILLPNSQAIRPYQEISYNL